MRTKLLFVQGLMALLAAGCGNPSGGGGAGAADPSLWALPAPHVSKVTVAAGGEDVVTYAYTYDAAGRMASLVKTDLVQKQKLLDLQYAYPAGADVTIVGKYYPVSVEKTLSVSLDVKSRTLTCSGSWVDAWTHATTFDGNGVVTGTVMDTDFRSDDGFYSSETAYRETYVVEGGDVTMAPLGTQDQSQSRRKTAVSSSSTLTVEYAYSEAEDRQNFGVYLMDCVFPVWVARGLPGCTHLITGMTARCGDVVQPGSFKVD